MITKNDKISNSELGIFLFLTIAGMGILILPARLADSVDSDAWLLSIATGMVCILFLFIICKVGERHHQLGFVGTLRFLFGNIIGTILVIPVAAYVIMQLAVQLRIFAEVTKLYLLQRTPLEFIILPMIVLTVILVRMGIEPITRSFGILIVVIAVVAIVLIVSSVPLLDFSNLLPVLTRPVSKYIYGLTTFPFAFAGFELMLMMFPYIKEPKKAFKTSAVAMLSVTALYTILVIECVAGLGTEETKSLIYPVMALTKAISIPGGFFENVEGLLNSLWVIYAFTTLVGFLYFFSVISADVFKHKRHKHFASMSIPLIYIVALQGNSIPEVLEFADFTMKYFATYTIVVLPILMLIFSYIRGNKKKEAK